ncbi:MAG: SDR family oxidoreductase [Treponema sp.]|nr:SDR family oxidoreductase [Treponema sp.]
MSYNPFSLINKTILVTGASSGIGKATAIECSKMGAKVIITARNEEKLKETLSLLEGDGHQMIIADLSNTDEIDNLVSQLPEINGLVNNAGKTITLPCNFITEEKLADIVSVNMTAPILLFSKLLKKKKLIKGSSVVFTSSINGIKTGSVGSSMYCATKGALSGFVKTAAIEYATKQIRVNCVCPGMINTNILEFGVVTEEQLVEDAKKYPLGRYGEPKEVAYAIIYLLSDASSFVTGTNLVIDGGFTIQ